MKLWIDDIRTPPDKGWTWAKTAQNAIALLTHNKVEMVSFDHDLGATDAYSVAMWIEKAASEGKIAPMKWKVHSMNVVGRQRITAAMKSAERFWANLDFSDKIAM